MNKKIVALVTTVLIALALVMVGSGVAKRAPERPGASRLPAIVSQSNQAADDNRPLKDKAKEVRNFVGGESPKGTAASDLAGLTKLSTDIIIGTALENHPTLSADGKTITLNYKVRVEYVYKGKLAEGADTTVSLPGGKVKFADGTTAEIQTGWFRKMLNGQTYALFLTPGVVNGVFVTTGQAQGVFDIPTTASDRVVKTHSGVPRDPINKYNNNDVKSFLKELRQVTKKPL